MLVFNYFPLTKNNIAHNRGKIKSCIKCGLYGQQAAISVLSYLVRKPFKGMSNILVPHMCIVFGDGFLANNPCTKLQCLDIVQALALSCGFMLILPLKKKGCLARVEIPFISRLSCYNNLKPYYLPLNR